jgi:hypothetical protein
VANGILILRGDFMQRDRTSGSHGEFEPGPLPFIVKFTGGGSENLFRMRIVGSRQ